jgi:hypothetical protein
VEEEEEEEGVEEEEEEEEATGESAAKDCVTKLSVCPFRISRCHLRNSCWKSEPRVEAT